MSAIAQSATAATANGRSSSVRENQREESWLMPSADLRLDEVAAAGRSAAEPRVIASRGVGNRDYARRREGILRPRYIHASQSSRESAGEHRDAPRCTPVSADTAGYRTRQAPAARPIRCPST